MPQNWKIKLFENMHMDENAIFYLFISLSFGFYMYIYLEKEKCDGYEFENAKRRVKMGGL